MFLYTILIDNEKDKDKFTQIYNLYRKTMLYIANQILHDIDLSEDATHIAFIKIMKNLSKIEEVTSHKTKGFVVIIVRNVSIDMYNEIHKRNTVPIDEQFDLKDDAQNVEDIIMSNQNYEVLIEAVKQLPDIYKDTFVLKNSHGFSNEIIAEILDITQDNVRKRLQVARQKLIKVLVEV